MSCGDLQMLFDKLLLWQRFLTSQNLRMTRSIVFFLLSRHMVKRGHEPQIFSVGIKKIALINITPINIFWVSYIINCIRQYKIWVAVTYRPTSCQKINLFSLIISRSRQIQFLYLRAGILATSLPTKWSFTLLNIDAKLQCTPSIGRERDAKESWISP